MKVLLTDLDGTLLDHATYRPGPAARWLGVLRSSGVEVVMASAKTVAELDALHGRLGLPRRFVAENGAVLVWDDAVTVFGLPFAAVRAGLDDAARRAGVGVRGYADMTVDEIARHTGLPPPDAALAADRHHSETFLLDGDAESLRVALADHGLTLVRGSRFLTVQGAHHKGTALPGILARTGPATTFAVGDAGNDEGMLRAVDHPMLVRAADGEHVPMAVPGLVRLDGIGPEGWVEAARLVRATPDP